MGKSYDPDFVFCTFQLKVIAEEGEGTVYNDEVYAYDISLQEVNVEKQDLQVKISDCDHTNMRSVDAKAPTCDEDGWHAYCYCDDCGLFFDENGEYAIASVPFILGGHIPSDELLFDEHGHWYNCTVCGEKVDETAHSGGTATCTTKAICEGCAQEYGEIDEHNHSASTYVENEKMTFPWENGYTGDVYCSECGQLIEQGEIISQWNFIEWPWWLIIVGFALFPVMLLFLLFFGRV
jgi:hypothetical protein